MHQPWNSAALPDLHCEVTTQGFVDLGKLAAFLKEVPAVRPPEKGSTFQFHGGAVEFRNVHYSYAHNAVLQGASLDVKPGSKVAIVGPSGSGKSTLLRLLYRLNDPQLGQVLIDGQDVKTLDMASFRRFLGIVPQAAGVLVLLVVLVVLVDTLCRALDCALFNDTISFGLSHSPVEWAAKLAQIHEHIESLPEGLGPSGDRLSHPARDDQIYMKRV
eukprot:Skav228133  [mRNA]  locus=scaffold1220:545867:550267:+ [translate_table: standard]